MRKRAIIENLRTSFGKIKDEEFQFDLIKRYFDKKHNSDAFQILSDKTCNDLDFEELFMFLDRTTSKIGQQYLYHKLRVISKHEDVAKNERLIQKLTDDEVLRIQTQQKLSKLSKSDAYYISSLFQDEHDKAPKWFSIVPVLSFTSLLSLFMIPFVPKALFILLGTLMINLFVHYSNKKLLNKYLVSLPQLIHLNNIVIDLLKNPDLEIINTNIKSASREVNKIKKRMFIFRLEVSLQGDFSAFVWFFLEILKMTFLIEPLLLFSALKRIENKKEEIEELFAFVGEIDSLISIASLRSGLHQYCKPIIEQNRILAKDMYHPLIIDCITNSIEVSDKSILLTGSNMSGKTSFIRAVGLNVITGLTINTCFAKSMVIPKVPVYSAIRINDDLMNDKSYYFEEVLTVKEMIELSTDETPALFLLDELFKGTNTIERISAGKAVLSTLAQNNNIVFVSTHDIELTEMLSKEYQLYHFSEVVNENKVDFDYKLKEGKLKNRNAIRILQINDYPHSLIQEAMDISKLLDEQTAENSNALEFFPK